MNEAEEIKKLKAQLEETRGELLKAQLKIMDLECTLKSSSRRLIDILGILGG
jgi:ATP-dependent helicase/DNAse subunit B